MRGLKIIVSCEHASNRVPKPYRHLFVGRERLLNSHRGFDSGALELARRVAKPFGAPLFAATFTRLLIDPNRTRKRRSLFSEITKPLPAATREELISRYFQPHQEKLRAEIDRVIRRGYVALHFGIHTFTPVYRGERRRVDAGILYDPARPAEKRFAAEAKAALQRISPRLRVFRNQPFLGKTLGFTGWLRRFFVDPHYLGIEIELSQKFFRRGPSAWRRAQEQLIAALVQAVDAYRAS